jgi:putative oxidoreductase
VSYAQVGAGALLILGLLTPLAGLALAAIMLGAVVSLIRRGEPFVSPHGHSWEAAGFYLVACTVIALLGPGGYALDAALFGRLWPSGRREETP